MSTKGTSSSCSADKLATSERTRRAPTNYGPSQERARCSGLWKREENEHVYVRYELFFSFFSFFFFPFSFRLSISIFNFQFSIFNFRFPFQFSFPFYNFNFPGVLALGLGENRTFCAIVSREFYWTSTAAVHHAGLFELEAERCGGHGETA